MLSRRDGHAAAGVSQDVGRLGVAQLDVQGDGHAPRGREAKVSHGPLRPVFADQGDAVTRGETGPDEGPGHRPGLPSHPSVRETAVLLTLP